MFRLHEVWLWQFCKRVGMHCGRPTMKSRASLSRLWLWAHPWGCHSGDCVLRLLLCCCWHTSRHRALPSCVFCPFCCHGRIPAQSACILTLQNPLVPAHVFLDLFAGEPLGGVDLFKSKTFRFRCLWCQFPADIQETFSIFFVSFLDGLFSRAMLISGSTHFDVWTIRIVCVYIGSTTQAKETCQSIIFPCLRTSKWLIPLDSFWQGIRLIYYDLFSPHFKHNFGKSETMFCFSGNLFAAHFLVSWWNGVTTTTSCCWHLQNKTRCIWCGWWLKSCTIG